MTHAELGKSNSSTQLFLPPQSIEVKVRRDFDLPIRATVVPHRLCFLCGWFKASIVYFDYWRSLSFRSWFKFAIIYMSNKYSMIHFIHYKSCIWNVFSFWFTAHSCKISHVNYATIIFLLYYYCNVIMVIDVLWIRLSLPSRLNLFMYFLKPKKWNDSSYLTSKS